MKLHFMVRSIKYITIPHFKNNVIYVCGFPLKSKCTEKTRRFLDDRVKAGANISFLLAWSLLLCCYSYQPGFHLEIDFDLIFTFISLLFTFPENHSQGHNSIQCSAQIGNSSFNRLSTYIHLFDILIQLKLSNSMYCTRLQHLCPMPQGNDCKPGKCTVISAQTQIHSIEHLSSFQTCDKALLMLQQQYSCTCLVYYYK